MLQLLPLPLVSAEATVTVPRTWQVRITILEAVMAVVATVTVPATRTAVPTEALVPVATLTFVAVTVPLTSSVVAGLLPIPRRPVFDGI